MLISAYLTDKQETSVTNFLKTTACCVVFAALAITIGCTQEETASPSSPLSSPATNSPLPTPTLAATAQNEDTPSQTHTPEPSTSIVFPTSQPGLATIVGTLSRRGSNEGFQGMELYLSEMIETSDPDAAVVGVNESSDPKAMLDVNSGDFAFYDVPPGRYALAITRPLLVPILVNDPGENRTLVVTPEPDETIDLGTLSVTIPE